MATVMTQTAGKPFGAALRELLIGREEYETHTGNINWRTVADSLKGVHYETLRKAVAGDRPATASLIEQVAALCDVQPDYFMEYQLAQAQRQFDVKEVGWECAMENLREWSKLQARRRKS